MPGRRSRAPGARRRRGRRRRRPTARSPAPPVPAAAGRPGQHLDHRRPASLAHPHQGAGEPGGPVPPSAPGHQWTTTIGSVDGHAVGDVDHHRVADEGVVQADQGVAAGRAPRRAPLARRRRRPTRPPSLLGAGRAPGPRRDRPRRPPPGPTGAPPRRRSRHQVIGTGSPPHPAQRSRGRGCRSASSARPPPSRRGGAWTRIPRRPPTRRRSHRARSGRRWHRR